MKYRLNFNPIHPGGGGFRSPQVRKSDRLLSKRISNVTKLLDFSYNTYPELLVPFLAIFFWLGACQGGS